MTRATGVATGGHTGPVATADLVEGAVQERIGAGLRDTLMVAADIPVPAVGVGGASALTDVVDVTPEFDLALAGTDTGAAEGAGVTVAPNKHQERQHRHYG